MVNFVRNQFGVDGNDLKYDDVIAFFVNAKTENNHLEFKSGTSENKLPKNIYESICAMLNSDGGLIVWGAPREQKNTDSIKECVGELRPVKNQITRDDLIRTISDTIVPTPTNVQIFILEKNGDYVYIFHVQKSEYSPHQAFNKYFMRLDGQTKGAPHHYIEALFRKVRYPELKGLIKFDHIMFTDENYQHIQIIFQVSIINQSPLQNEEFPHFSVSVNHGTLLEHHNSWPHPAYTPTAGNSSAAHSPMEVLYFGRRVEKMYKLGLVTSSLQGMGGKVSVILIFGGRFSPLKYTSYDIDLTFFTSHRYIEKSAYPIPPENITIENDSALFIDTGFNADRIRDWNTIRS